MSLRDIFGNLLNKYTLPSGEKSINVPMTEIKGENPAGTAINGIKVNDDGTINIMVNGSVIALPFDLQYHQLTDEEAIPIKIVISANTLPMDLQYHQLTDAEALPMKIVGGTIAVPMDLQHHQLTSDTPLPIKPSDRNKIKIVTIATGESLSNEMDLEGYPMLAIEMPAAWDTANLTFQASSVSGGTFQDVYDDLGLEVVVIAAIGRVITIDTNALKLASLRYIKIRSGISAAPVLQTADRTLNIICKN